MPMLAQYFKNVVKFQIIILPKTQFMYLKTP